MLEGQYKGELREHPGLFSRKEDHLMRSCPCRVFHRRKRDIPWGIAVLISTIMMAGGIPTVVGGDISEEGRSDTRTSSMTGTSPIDSVSNCVIIGEALESESGDEGIYSWIGDIDGDGLNDLAVSFSSASDPGGNVREGEIYFWYGDGSFPEGAIDLEITQPDLVIRGGPEDAQLLEIMEVGDLDDDGLADLVLGIPLQPRCGRVNILWGREGGWPSEIQLPDPGPLNPSGNAVDPYGFSRSQDITIIGGYLRPVPQPKATYETGDDIVVEDLDGDGVVDLVFSSPGWNHIIIMWGGNDRWIFGEEYTLIEEYWDDDHPPSGKFGEEISVGDINGNGIPDIAVSAPFKMDEERSFDQVGYLFIYMDVGILRGNGTLNCFDLGHPIIKGRHPYDRFGSRVVLLDLNGDGKDEIMVGVPDADGKDETRRSCGQILIYNGRERNGFEKYMNAEETHDVLIYGAKGENDITFGHKMGNMFDLGDIDGDGRPELVVGINNEGAGSAIGAGRVYGYETEAFFPSGGGSVDLRSLKPRFDFKGLDQDDSLGHHVSVGDIDEDGIDDIIVTAPGADGVNNQRKRCGEVYLLQGKKLSIGDIEFTGDGVVSTYLFSGGKEIDVSINIASGYSAGEITVGMLVLDPDDSDIRIIFDGGEVGMDNDPTDQIGIIEGSCSLMEGGSNLFEIAFTMDWFVPMEGPVDLEVRIMEPGGTWVSRRYPEVVDVIKDVRISAVPDVLRNGERLHTRGCWLNEGDDLALTGSKVVYDMDGIVKEIPTGDLIVKVLSNGEERGSTIYSGSDWEIEDTADPSRTLYSVELGMDIPGGISREFVPNFGPSVHVRPRIDGNDPAPPGDVFLLPDGGEPGRYDDDDEWTLRWDSEMSSEGDGNQSGIMGYAVSMNSAAFREVMNPGGLHGTYFRGVETDEVVVNMTGVEGPIDFPDWSVFGPEPKEMPNENFSVRWHGWFMPPKTDVFTFSFAGIGKVKMYLDQTLILDWSEMTVSVMSGVLSENQPVPIVIYYCQEEAPSSITFRYEDERGWMVPVPASLLYHPANETTIVVKTSIFDIRVRSIDWVGRESTPVELTGYMDNEGPVFDLSEVPRWVPETRPQLSLKIHDGALGNVSGSGVDPDSVMYRVRERLSLEYGDWTEEGLKVLELGGGTVLVECTPELVVNRTDSIQWYAEDVVGNSVTSVNLNIEVDRTPPVIELLFPNIQIVQSSTMLDLTLRVSDRLGSGVRGETVSIRNRVMGGNWSDWLSADASGVQEEFTLDRRVVLPEGKVEIQFTAADLVDNIALSGPFQLTISLQPKDMPPVPVISYPQNGSSVRVGRSLPLDGFGTEDDGPYEDLEFTWYSNRSDGYLGSGERLLVYLTEVGTHRITLWVDDGILGNNVSTWVIVNVTPRDQNNGEMPDGGNRTGSDLLEILLLTFGVALVLGAAAVFLLTRYRRKKGDEVRVDYRRRTEDDVSYDRRLDREERELGIKVEKNNKSPEELEKERNRLYEDDSNY